MKPRLRMTPEEARYSREKMIPDMGALAAFVGAPSSSIEAIDAALRVKYSGSIRAKEATVPRLERWRVWFLRAPGGWLTRAQMVYPVDGPVFPGPRIPRYVKQAVPLTPDGILPMSLAPRREDLPRVAEGRWRGVAPKMKYDTPNVTVEVGAPRYGVLIWATGSDTDPLIVRFPANKAKLGPAVRRLAEYAKERYVRNVSVRLDGFEERIEREKSEGRECRECKTKQALDNFKHDRKYGREYWSHQCNGCRNKKLAVGRQKRRERETRRQATRRAKRVRVEVLPVREPEAVRMPGAHP